VGDPPVTGADDSVFAAVRAGDVDAVRALLAAGADPNRVEGGETPLHVAARSGPAALVEELIAGGALEWRPDAQGRLPLDVARLGSAGEKAEIVALLDRSAIADPAFREAVAALHAGDVVALERLLDAEPRLLRERNAGPEAYRRAKRPQYFRDPKLLWYVANNPKLVERMPPNAADVARAIVARGADRDDLDYTLSLVLSSAAAREAGLQLELARVLLAAGATLTRESLLVAAAHGEADTLRALVPDGLAGCILLAASLGDLETLRAALGDADRADMQAAFGLAVINGRTEAARQLLDAGADPNAPLPVHAHATALHQAALRDDPALLALLIERGADPARCDTLWNATPLGWALHEHRPAARAYLEAL
jgi:peptide-methionine (S)-S-oxide reductase